jgi:hypothetical protein
MLFIVLNITSFSSQAMVRGSSAVVITGAIRFAVIAMAAP